MILRIDHIGLATPEPGVLGPHLRALGMRRIDRGEAAAYRVACEFWQGSGGPGAPMLELVSPASAGSVLDARLAGAGSGLHHLAVEVDDLAGELDRLRAAGWAPVDREPSAGARAGMTVAFTYLPRPAGLLLELVHYRR